MQNLQAVPISYTVILAHLGCSVPGPGMSVATVTKYGGNMTTEMLRSYESLYKSELGPLERLLNVSHADFLIVLRTNLRIITLTKNGDYIYAIPA